MKVFKWLDDHLEEVLLGILLAVITIVMFIQVILRFVFSSALVWAEELCRTCYVWTCFISAAYCVKINKHLRVMTIVELVPRKVQVVCAFLTDFLLLVLWGILLYSSVPVVAKTFRGGQTWASVKLPLGIIYMATIVGFIFAIFRTLQAMYLRFKRVKAGGPVNAKAVSE